MRRTQTLCKRKISDSEEASPAKSAKKESACLFCSTSEVNDLELGELVTKDDITVHYFCMLLSSGLCQKGKTSNAKHVKGFRPEDILKEQKRGGRLKCCFCHKKGATIGCTGHYCKKSFHLSCGRKNGVLNHFFGSFRSYCKAHWPKEIASDTCRLPLNAHDTTECLICLSTLEFSSSPDIVCSPCCKKSWYHRLCMQQYALSAGKYFFKCPFCNNLEKFQKDMLNLGMYIPDQDASWERQPDAYSELLERHNTCDAAECQCPEGRGHDAESGRYDLILCQSCGSFGSHRRCQGLTRIGTSLLCPVCTEMALAASREAGPSGGQGSRGPPRGQSQNYPATCRLTSYGEEDCEVDIENSSDVEDDVLQQKRSRPQDKSLVTLTKGNGMDCGISYLTVVHNMESSKAWRSSLSPIIKLSKIDSLVSIRRGKVKLNVMLEWKYNKDTGCLEKRRSYSKHGRYKKKSANANNSKGSTQKGAQRGQMRKSKHVFRKKTSANVINSKGSTQKEAHYEGIRKSKHLCHKKTFADVNKSKGTTRKEAHFGQMEKSKYVRCKKTSADVNKSKGITRKEAHFGLKGKSKNVRNAVNQASKLKGRSLTQMKLDMLWGKIFTVARMQGKTTTGSKSLVDCSAPLDGGRKAQGKAMASIGGSTHRKVRMKVMTADLELDLDGASPSGRATAVLLGSRAGDCQEKAIQRSVRQDGMVGKVSDDLEISEEGENNVTEGSCSSKRSKFVETSQFDDPEISGEEEKNETEKSCNSNTSKFVETSQLDRENGTPVDNLEESQNDENKISESLPSPALNKLKSQKSIAALQSSTPGSPKATGANSIATCESFPPWDWKCSGHLQMPESNLPLLKLEQECLDEPEVLALDSFRPVCSDGVEAPEKVLPHKLHCSNRAVDAPEENISHEPTCSIKVETPVMATSLKTVSSVSDETCESAKPPSSSDIIYDNADWPESTSSDCTQDKDTVKTSSEIYTPSPSHGPHSDLTGSQSAYCEASSENGPTSPSLIAGKVNCDNSSDPQHWGNNLQLLELRDMNSSDFYNQAVTAPENTGVESIVLLVPQARQQNETLRDSPGSDENKNHSTPKLKKTTPSNVPSHHTQCKILHSTETWVLL